MAESTNAAQPPAGEARTLTLNPQQMRMMREAAEAVAEAKAVQHLVIRGVLAAAGVDGSKVEAFEGNTLRVILPAPAGE